ncbi:hypothetical protein Tco_0684308 [Tanacetum coccineum]
MLCASCRSDHLKPNGADAIISALVKDVVGRLTSAAIQYGLFRGLENDEWLRTLKSTSLEVENVVASTEAMLQRLYSEKGNTHKLRIFFSAHRNSLIVKSRIAHKVKKFRRKLDVIDANR